ncbi:hypothetical protein EDC94DRAFT_524544, partial [Helicostylum pulchrum]
KLWNRDLAAVLNFRKILVSLRETSRRPEIFTRKQTSKNNLSTRVIALTNLCR